MLFAEPAGTKAFSEDCTCAICDLLIVTLGNVCVFKVEEPWSVASNISVSDDDQAASARTPGVESTDDNWLYMSAVCYLYGLGVGTNPTRYIYQPNLLITPAIFLLF